MAKCAYCNSTLLLGGRKHGEFSCCNDKCYQQGIVLTVAKHVPNEMVQKQANDIHRGRCSKCNRAGLVDVHTSYISVTCDK